MVQTGLETLLASGLDRLKERRVGLVTHPAAVLPDLTHALDALLAAGIKLVPSHPPRSDQRRAGPLL